MTYRQAIADLQVAIAKEEEFLVQHSGVAAQELAQRQVTAQKVAAHLPAESALVEFVRTQDWHEKKDRVHERYLAFVLTSDNRVMLVDLGEAAEIDTAINETLAAISNTDIRSQASVRGRCEARGVDGQLFLPLVASVGTSKRLIVSPDGELNRVPFAALRTPDGRYLIEELTLSYVASGRDLLREERGEPAPVDLLLVANPAFDNREVLQTMALSHDALRAADYEGRFAPLAGTAEEARAISLLVKGTQQVLEGREATEAAVRTTKPPRVFHLATHGFFLKDNEELFPSSDSLAHPNLLSTGLGEGRAKQGSRSLPVSSRPIIRMNPMVRQAWC